MPSRKRMNQNVDLLCAHFIESIFHKECRESSRNDFNVELKTMRETFSVRKISVSATTLPPGCSFSFSLRKRSHTPQQRLFARFIERKEKKKKVAEISLEPLFFSLYVSLSGRLDDAKDISLRKSNYTPFHELLKSEPTWWASSLSFKLV